GEVFGHRTFFGPVPVPIDRIVNELEGEKRNAQRQKRVSPVQGIVGGIAPVQSRQEIAILEQSQKQDRLSDAEPADPGRGSIETAAQRLPEENRQASGSGNSSKLSIGKVGEEQAAAGKDHPRPQQRACRPANNGARDQEQKVVVPGVEYHVSPTGVAGRWRRDDFMRLSAAFQ